MLPKTINNKFMFSSCGKMSLKMNPYSSQPKRKETISDTIPETTKFFAFIIFKSLITRVLKVLKNNQLSGVIY